LNAVSVYFGFFGSNYGDLAVTRGGLDLLKMAAGTVDIILVTPPLKTRVQRAAQKTTQLLHPGIECRTWDLSLAALRGETSPNLEFIEELLSANRLRAALGEAAGFARSSAVVYTGGEHLFSYGSAGEDWNLLGRLLPLLAAARSGLKTAVAPTTFGPFKSEFSRALFNMAAESCDCLLYRDASSAGFAERARPGLDPAFFLSDYKFRPAARGGPVGLALRLDGFGMRLGAEASRRRSEEVRRGGFRDADAFLIGTTLAREAASRGRQVRIMVQCEADRELAYAICRACDDPGVTVVEPRSMAQYIKEISVCEYVVTSRFHTCIFAMASGVPVFGLHHAEHGHKIPGLFDLVGSSSCMQVGDVVADELAQQVVIRMETDRNQRGDTGLEDRLNAMRAETVERLAAVLGGG